MICNECGRKVRGRYPAPSGLCKECRHDVERDGKPLPVAPKVREITPEILERETVEAEQTTKPQPSDFVMVEVSTCDEASKAVKDGSAAFYCGYAAAGKDAVPVVFMKNC